MAVVVGFPAGSDPDVMPMRRTIPMARAPHLMAGSAIPIATHPDVIGAGTGGFHDDFVARGRRGSVDPYVQGNLSLQGRGREANDRDETQTCRKQSRAAGYV
jgi:hypothetical protein